MGWAEIGPERPNLRADLWFGGRLGRDLGGAASSWTELDTAGLIGSR